ncbi:hypothetical protein [Caldalkalibacillus mannanilyticus]|uniref:hypothetical protein n=1 Tax=Caldalkalibacillus mannanilyticus TaxID=1418 RepID=UPI00046A5489|nr:hypothetical protein [Caldalkalibacillus mannanilyticus]
MRRIKNSKILLAIFIVGIIPMILFAIFQYYSYQHISQLKEEAIEKEILQAQLYIDTMFKDLDRDLNLLTLNPNIRQADDSISTFYNEVGTWIDLNQSHHMGLEGTIYAEIERYAYTHPENAYVYLGTIHGALSYGLMK